LGFRQCLDRRPQLVDQRIAVADFLSLLEAPLKPALAIRESPPARAHGTLIDDRFVERSAAEIAAAMNA
jgi:hypothetical protein